MSRRRVSFGSRCYAGGKGYATNLITQSSAFVIDAYHQLWHVEKAFPMSKHDLQAQPIYHHLREAIAKIGGKLELWDETECGATTQMGHTHC